MKLRCVAGGRAGGRGGGRDRERESVKVCKRERERAL